MQATSSRFQKSLARQIIGGSYESPYAARYASNWSSTAKRCKRLTGGYCCFPGCWRRDGVEAHHTVYRDKDGKSIAGEEIPGIHCFGLCQWHHIGRHKDAAHALCNYNGGILPPPTLDACNTPEYWLLLRQGWLEKRAYVERQKQKKGRSA